jgi:hypothetical protein
MPPTKQATPLALEIVRAHYGGTVGDSIFNKQFKHRDVTGLLQVWRTEHFENGQAGQDRFAGGNRMGGQGMSSNSSTVTSPA